MKTPLWSTVVALFLGISTGSAQGQDAGNERSGPTVAERGPHHRIWQSVSRYVTSFGRERFETNSYAELATGMNYTNELGEWTESKEEIEIFQGAAVARQGQHQAIFAANLHSPGAIDLLAPDGKRFRSHILGLAYTDYASGQSTLIAEVKDCQGAVLPPNQVLYQDAFAGDCLADVRYTYTRAGFEQDIILLTAPPSPARYGFNPETTRLEVFTEFIEAPEATITSVVLRQEPDPVARQQMAEPDLIDQQLDFGVMKIGAGQAFPLGQAEPFGDATVPTGKSLQRIDGRLFLIEKVDYPGIREQLGLLPQAAANQPRKVVAPANGQPMFAGLLPRTPAGAPGKWKDRQFAKIELNRKGFVLDYVTINSSLTNYIFKGDTTYYVSGTVDLYNTTIFEEGTVIKFASSTVNVRGPVDCQTSPYRPAIFTGKDDDTIGEIISGSSGTPGNSYGSSSGMVVLYDTTTTYDLHDLRVTYPYRAFTAQSSVKANFSNFQVGKGQMALGQQSASTVTCRNFLFYDLVLRGTVISGTPTNRSEHGTFHRVADFRSSTNGLFTLTNSLLISVTNNLVFEGANNITSLDDTGFFQTIGSGARYLINDSTNRNAGTTNINPALLAALKKRTTYPPVVLSNNITSDTILGTQAQRDTDTPDLGYHYDVLDWLAGGMVITNSTLTLTNSATFGIDASATNYGLRLASGASIVSVGTPDNLNRFVRNHNVQEIPVGAAAVPTPLIADTVPLPASATALRCRFTDFPMLAGSYLFNQEWGNGTLTTLDLRDSQLRGGRMTLFPKSTNNVTTLTNCLLDRVRSRIQEYAATKFYAYNNLFREGTNYVELNFSGNVWEWKNNFFDKTLLSQAGSGTLTNDYNGYVTNCTRLSPNGSHDKILTASPTYETNWLGRYYLPTNSPLIDAGSTIATNLGLYHYTTTANQVRETNSTVDISFHYVAVNNSGLPIDTDGDGLADYFEDVNGNGSVDSGETNWSSTDTDGDGVSDYLEYLLGRNPLVAGTTNDVNGVLNLRLYTPLK